MKHKFDGKSFVCGLLVMAMIITLAMPVSAALTRSSITIDSGIRIVVDGKELVPKDVNGRTVDVFASQGTTYLPVRAISDALGKAIYWDGPSFTVYVGNMDGKLEYPTVLLRDLKSVNDSPGAASSQMLTDNYGNSYNTALSNKTTNYTDRHTSMEFLVNMKYSRLKGTLYVPQGTTSNNTCRLTVEADGRVLYTSPAMNKTSYPIDVDINVSGYNDIKVKFSVDASGYDVSFPLCFANAGFYQ